MISFTIESKLPSLNDYINTLKSPKGQHTGARMKSDVDDICIWCLKRCRSELKAFCAEPVIIWLEWHESSKRRDLDNVYSASKYILDAMQKSGIIANDNYKHIKGIYNSVCYGTKDYVEARLYHLDEIGEFFKAFSASEILRIRSEKK